MAFEIMHTVGLPVPMNMVGRTAVNFKEALSVVQFIQSRNIPIILPKDFLCMNNLDPEKWDIFSADCHLDGEVNILFCYFTWLS